MSNSAPPSNSCLIVGAGICGLIAARTLIDAGHHVTVLDKGRGVGGRMATRRFGGDRFDHGTQFFTARDSSFNTLVREWRQAGILEKWSTGFPSEESAAHGDHHACYRGIEGMNRIPKHLTAGVKIRTGVQGKSITRIPSGWAVTDADDVCYRTNSLILTPPVPQSLALARTGNISLPDVVQKDLESIAYRRCIALLVRLPGPSCIPPPGAIWLPEEPVYWIADNQIKGTSSSSDRHGCLTLHAGPVFSERQWTADDALVAREMLHAAGKWIGTAPPVAWQIHRWRYAEPTRVHLEPYAALSGHSPVLFAGDAFAGPGVEGASRSGLAAARHIIERSGGRPAEPIFNLPA